MEVYIDLKDSEKNNDFFQHLFSQREALERGYGCALAWEPLETRRACRIAEYRPGSIEDDAEMLEAHKEWGVQRLLRLRQVFGDQVAQIP